MSTGPTPTAAGIVPAAPVAAAAATGTAAAQLPPAIPPPPQASPPTAVHVPSTADALAPGLAETTFAYVPVVYGSCAFWLGNKAVGSEKEHSHNWCVFVRGAHGQDISFCIAKVVFTLHPTIPEPIKQVTAPPFMVKASGWGEFEIGIRIFFHDPTQKPVSVNHLLKLHPPGHAPPSVHKPVVSETYDEIVFVDPTPTMAKLLALPANVDAIRAHDPEAAGAGAGAGAGSAAGGASAAELRAKYNKDMHPTGLEEFLHTFDPSADMAAIDAAHAFVAKEIEVLQERLLRAQSEKRQMTASVAALGGGADDE